MTTWLVRRVAASIAIVFAVVTFTFLLLHLSPGQPFLPGVETPIDPAVVAQLRRQFGLDQPVLVQYVKYLGALLHGNLGVSFALHRPVADALADAIPNTLVLASAALALDLLLGLALGVYQAVHAHRLPDIGLGYATLFVGSLPTFWLALFLLLVFGQWLGWFPVSGREGIQSLVLPALTLGTGMTAILARMIRGVLLETLEEDYIRTARAKGLPEHAVVLRHGLRNALLPVVTLLGLQLGALLSGAVITETIFSWPGIGRLLVQSIGFRDYPMVQGCILFIAVTYVGVNLATDLIYGVLDPRIRHR